jgi:hypothetical protein
LGGVWNVHGAYTFYTFDCHAIENAVLVDTEFSRAALDRARDYPNLTTLAGNFGDEAVIEQVGTVDVLYLFDVLLHQVSPDWDEILDRYACQTRYMAIFNKQYTAGERTVRLLDLGRREYFENVPRSPDDGPYSGLFDKLDKIHPKYNRPWRDIHNIWQWGITDKDLMNKMESLGFKLQYYMNCGQFRRLEHFENHAFLFKKIDPPAPHSTPSVTGAPHSA